jgi:hypothetical protein
MTQLSKFMIYHYHVFGGFPRASRPCETTYQQNGSECSASTPGQSQPDNSHDNANIINSTELDQYFEAADNILTIVNRSCDEHVRYVNPFLASTIWLAAAVQLIYKLFGPPGTNGNLIKSKFDVISLNYKQFVGYWHMSTALQQNLDSLEMQLERFRIPQQNDEECSRYENSSSELGNDKPPSVSNSNSYGVRGTNARSGGSVPAGFTLNMPINPHEPRPSVRPKIASLTLNNNADARPSSHHFTSSLIQTSDQRQANQRYTDIYSPNLSSLALASSLQPPANHNVGDSSRISPSATATPPFTQAVVPPTELIDGMNYGLDWGGMNMEMLGGFLMGSYAD